jgi:hypothetical protein
MADTSPPRRHPQPRHDAASIWAQLLPLIASGASLPAALAQLPEPRPSLWWAKMAIRHDPALEERYRAATELRADALADEIAAIADEPIPPDLHGSDASAFVQRQRLRVDAKKWLACKLFPRRWGDRLDVNVDVEQRISITAALAAAEARIDTIKAAEPESLARIGEVTKRGESAPPLFPCLSPPTASGFCIANQSAAVGSQSSQSMYHSKEC